MTPYIQKKLQSRFDKLLAVLEKQCQKTCRPMGFDYPFYHEPAKIPADHFQDCDEKKTPSSKLTKYKLLFWITFESLIMKFMTKKKKFSAMKFSIYTILTTCKIATIFNFIFCKYFLIWTIYVNGRLKTKTVRLTLSWI